MSFLLIVECPGDVDTGRSRMPNAFINTQAVPLNQWLQIEDPSRFVRLTFLSSDLNKIMVGLVLIMISRSAQFGFIKGGNDE